MHSQICNFTLFFSLLKLFTYKSFAYFSPFKRTITCSFSCFNYLICCKRSWYSSDVTTSNLSWKFIGTYFSYGSSFCNFKPFSFYDSLIQLGMVPFAGLFCLDIFGSCWPWDWARLTDLHLFLEWLGLGLGILIHSSKGIKNRVSHELPSIMIIKFDNPKWPNHKIKINCHAI